MKPNRAALPVAVLLLPVLGLSACATDASTARQTVHPSAVASPAGGGTTTTADAATPEGPTVECTYTADGDPARRVDPPPTTAPAIGTVTATLATSEGDVTITMDRSKAPCTVNSFESLAKQGYFDNTQCHRLVDSGIFVLQCGDPTGTGRGGPGYRFPDELSGKETYPAGTVAMANTGQPGTNGSQFFLVYQDSLTLNAAYTVFGTMDSAGVDAVGKIAAMGQDGSSGAAGGGKPNNDAAITTVTLG